MKIQSSKEMLIYLNDIKYIFQRCVNNLREVENFKSTKLCEALGNSLKKTVLKDDVVLSMIQELFDFKALSSFSGDFSSKKVGTEVDEIFNSGLDQPSILEATALPTIVPANYITSSDQCDVDIYRVEGN